MGALFLFGFLILIFDTGTYYVAKAVLELEIILPQLPNCYK